MPIHLIIVRVVNVGGVSLRPAGDGVIHTRGDKLRMRVMRLYQIYSVQCHSDVSHLIGVSGLLVAPGGGLDVVGDDGAPGDQVEEQADRQGGHQVGGHRGHPHLLRPAWRQRQAGLNLTENVDSFIKSF